MHCGHSEELPRLLLEEEVSAAPLGGAHLPETSERSAGPPSVRPATRGEEEEAGGGGGGAAQEDGGGGEVGDMIADESVTESSAFLMTFIAEFGLKSRSWCQAAERWSELTMSS